MKPTYLSLESLDDRKEIWHLLHRMPPARRLAYLARCCLAVSDARGNGPRPTPDMRDRWVPEAARCGRADERLTNAVYCDLVQLAANLRLDLAAVALDLERVARGRVVPLQDAALRA